MGVIYLGPYSVAEDVLWEVCPEQGIDVESPQPAQTLLEVAYGLSQDTTSIGIVPASYLGQGRHTLSFLFRLPPPWRVVGYVPIQCNVWLWKRPEMEVGLETPIVAPLEWKWAVEAALEAEGRRNFRTSALHTAEAAEQVARSEEPLLALARWKEGRAYGLEPIHTEPIPAEDFPFGVYLVATEMIAGASHSDSTLLALREEPSVLEKALTQVQGMPRRSLRKEFPLVDPSGQRWLVIEYGGHCSLPPLCDYLRALVQPLPPEAWRILGAYHVYDPLIC